MPAKGKQGARGQKQIVEENAATLTFYRNTLIAVNAVFFTVYWLLFWEQFTTLPITLWVASLMVAGGSLQFMRSVARPTYSQEGALVDCGIDLNMEAGMAEHLKDLVLLTAMVQTSSLLSNYFWLLLLLAPARALHMLWVNILGPWFFAEAPEQSAADDKKARKMERQRKRLQR